MSSRVQHVWEVGSADRLQALERLPLPAGIGVRSERRFFRDLYLDTPQGDLRRRGVRCRFRIGSDDRATLRLTLPATGEDGTPRIERFEMPVRGLDVVAALARDHTTTRRLRAIVDPAELHPVLELMIDRTTRRTRRRVPWGASLAVDFEGVTVRCGIVTRTFHHIRVQARSAQSAAAATVDDAIAAAGAFRTTLSRYERAALVMKWLPASELATGAVAAPPPAPSPDTALDPDVSFLESQRRVLALAEDPGTPFAERCRFVAIVARNIDEFFAVRVAGLKLRTPEQTEESAVAGGAPLHLGAIAASARALLARQSEVARELLDRAAAHGATVRRWESLSPAEVEWLGVVYQDAVHPELTPFAMTLSPGHPVPHLVTLTLSVAVLLRDARTGARHLAQVELPERVPRFLAVAADGTRAAGVVLAEDVVRHHLDRLYPAHVVEEAGCFRVTRGAELSVDDERVPDLLDAVDDAARQRIRNGIVRVEVEQGMSPVMRELLLDELSREARMTGLPLGPEDVYEVAAPLELQLLDALPLDADRALRYRPFVPEDPFAEAPSLLDLVRAGDLLVHHPFQSFERTVVRFVREAADDPDVTAVKITLYRAGDRSPIVDALRDAARAGKQVHAFVELRARFDEARNVGWVRALERAGVHVVYGLRGVKTHAKAALVVRRDPDGPRCYAHVGSGNYNAQTGGAYTDLSLFTAARDVTRDIGDLFNALTGATLPVIVARHGALVAPAQLLPGLLERVAREQAHALAGREAAIRIKVNGLSDASVVEVLRAASRSGVRVELVVRSICTLRPEPAAGGIRVVANVGRFLEHSRIFHFANGGEPEWFIGSADLRTRNLRRRIELLVPVRDPLHRAALDRLLQLYLDDPGGWELDGAGEYTRRAGAGPGPQERLLAELAVRAAPNIMGVHALEDSSRVDFAAGAR